MATTQQFVEWLEQLIEASEDVDVDGLAAFDIVPKRVWTFEDQGMLTRDQGLTVKLADRSRFQVTVARERGD